jgi:hypothetical protein
MPRRVDLEALLDLGFGDDAAKPARKLSHQHDGFLGLRLPGLVLGGEPFGEQPIDLGAVVRDGVHDLSAQPRPGSDIAATEPIPVLVGCRAFERSLQAVEQAEIHPAIVVPARGASCST